MEFLKKHKKRLIKAVFLIPLSIILAFYLIYPHQYPFIDMRVLGSSRDELIEMYGEPRHESFWLGTPYIAYSVTKKPYSLKTKKILWYNGGTAEGVWYYIFLDENSVAYDVQIQLQAGG